MFGKYDDSELRRRIGDLEIENEKLKTHINSVRGLMNRKISKDLDNDESALEEKPKSKKDSMLIPV